MNRFITKLTCIGIFACNQLFAQSPVVTVPPTAGTTVWGGVTFNVTSTADITIDTLYCNTSGTAPTPVTLEVWYRPSAITAQPLQAEFPGVYTSIVAGQSVIGGTDLAPIVIPGGLFLPAGQTFGFYIGDPAFSTTGIRYGAANAGISFTNGPVTITTGTNITFGWVRNGTVTNAPRYFAGGVGYHLGASSGGGPTTVPPIASFAYNDGDTVWLNNPRNMVNTSNGATRSYWDILGYNSNSKVGPFLSVTAARQCKNTEGINDCFIDTTNQTNNFLWTYTQAGYYRLKVTAINKYGNDTYIDTIYVDTPATKPHSEFFIDKRVIGVNDFASCFDLSSNGPTSWYWYLKSNNPNPNPLNPNRFTPFNTSQNPNLNAFDGGLFDMCLVTRNARGADTMCKKDYIRIIPGYPVCAGQSADKDTIARDQEGSVVLSTVGGTYLPQLIGTCGKGFTVATCSDTVIMFLERFKMRSLVTAGVSDSLLIHQGTVSGLVIARFGGLGSTIPQAQRTFKVPGGIAYFETKLANTTGLTGDSGYAVRWISTPPTYTKPHAAFSVPDTIYDKYTVQYINQSTGVQMKYAWDTNGDNVYGLDNPSSSIDSTSKSPSRSFNVFAPYKANICLKTFNCVGADTTCKQVQFLPISTSPVAEFTVSRFTGFTTDTFQFTDLTQNGATSWNWTFVPNNVAYLNGTNAASQHPMVLLNSATAYDVTLTATNPLGSNSITKLSYATAIAFNSPGCSGCPGNAVPGSVDVGISRVTLADMDTSTALSTPIYHALYNIKTATLYRGVTYTVSTARTTNSSPMSTRAWIDFNHNTNFGDEPIEVVITENNQYKTVTTATFKVPDTAPLGNTRMRVGVTLGGTTITQSVTTLGCYEDYGILIGTDMVKPILSLLGSGIEKVEVHKTYTDSGAVATDNLEGDISSRYQVIGTVDTSKVGYYTLKYIVTDLYGNVSDTAYRTVQVEINQTGPSVTLNGDDTVYVDVFGSYTELNATAKSNTGLDYTALIVRKGKVDTTILGTYVISYAITDMFNFTATAKRWVIVQDTIKPTINSLAGSQIFNHQVGLPYNDPIVVSDNYWKGITATRTGIINPNVPGSYNLQYNAHDGSGNIASTFYATVVVKDLIPPTVTLLGADPMIVDVFTTFNDPGIKDTDNYYPSLITIRTGVPTMTTIGVFTVTYTVTDGAQNTTIVSRTVQVVDRKVPEIQILGQNPVTHHRYTPYIDGVIKLVDNYYSEDVLRPLLVTDLSGLNVNEPGLYFVTYTLTDPSGNKAQKAQRLVEVVEFTGLHELANTTSLTVYPNPNTGKFTIAVPENVRLTTIKIIDILGREVKTPLHTQNTVDISDLQKGIYQMVAEDENGGMYAAKIILE
jgi:PKD repeat protein